MLVATCKRLSAYECGGDDGLIDTATNIPQLQGREPHIMSPQRHIIKRQVFELTVGRATDVQRLQTEVSRIYRQRIVPLIEQYCTALSAPDRIHRIARARVSTWARWICGIWKTPLVARISAQLGTLLADQISVQEHYTASPDTHPKTMSQLELFSLFVQTGSLPWWADAGQPHLLEDCLHHLMQYAPGPLCRVLRELAHDSRCLQRLVQHYGDAHLAALCDVLAPALRGSLAASPDRPHGRLANDHIPTAGRPAQRRTSAWSTIVSLASLRGQDYREPFSFFRELLPRLARVWQVTPAVLLATIRQALQQGPMLSRAASGSHDRTPRARPPRRQRPCRGQSARPAGAVATRGGCPGQPGGPPHAHPRVGASPRARAVAGGTGTARTLVQLSCGEPGRGNSLPLDGGGQGWG